MEVKIRNKMKVVTFVSNSPKISLSYCDQKENRKLMLIVFIKIIPK